MSWIDIQNGESGLSVRNKLNSAFASLVSLINKSLKLQGSVTSFSMLPTSATLGDTYFCEAEGLFYFYEDNKWNPMGGESKIKFTPTTTIGGISKDKPIDKTPSEILRDMLCPYVSPSITSKSVSSSILLYGKTYSSFKISVTAKKGSNPLKSITIDGTENTVTETTESVTKSKTFSLTPKDTTKTSLSYNVSVKDNQNNTVSSTVSTSLTGGVFMFFSTAETLSKTMELDFTTHHCQSERLTPDGSYSLTHSGKEYFYIVVPTSMQVKTVRSSNIDVPMTELFVSDTMKQGESGNQVTLSMRVYRNASGAMDAGTFAFIVNPKDN